VSGRALRAFAVALLLAAAGIGEARADVDDALAAFKAGRYLEAASEIQALLDRNTNYAYGHFLLGHCMLKTGHVREADREFRRALQLSPTRPEYYEALALASNAAGNWPLSLRAASQGLAFASDPQARYALLALRGYAWGAMRRWNDAVADLEAAQRIHVEPWLLVFLGKARFATGAYAEALPPLRRALQASPDDPEVLRLLAENLLRLAAEERDPVRKRFNYTEALSFAQRLVSVIPDDLDAAHLVGRAALGAGRLEQAENVFRHVLANDPRQCYALANLGRTYMASARWQDAETFLWKAAACAPRLSTVYESLGELYMQVGRPQDAAAAYRRADEIEPSRRAADLPATVPVVAPR